MTDNTDIPFNRSQSTDSSFNNVRRVRPNSLFSASHQTISVERPSLEGALHIRENLNNVISEIQPLMETARFVNAGSLFNLLNRPTPSGTNNLIQTPSPVNNESTIIDIGNFAAASASDVPGNAHFNADLHSHAAVLLNNPSDENPTNNNNPDDFNNADRIQSGLDARRYWSALLKHVPCILILLAKGVYDHHKEIFNIVVLFATFIYANSVVKNQALKRGQRNLSKLRLALLYIAACIFFIYYVFEDKKLYLNLLFIRTYDKPLSVWDLLWFVIITDFILKLITIAVKICLTMLPGKLVAFQERGKIYLFIEAISQLYRSLATIQPWLFYLLESYQGLEKIIGLFLSASYMVSKGADLMSRLKLLRAATFKLLQSVAIGSSPSKEQIQQSGDFCPICHDQYDSPVLLQCRHIFCESCVSAWFDREQTCPLCRAKIMDDLSWRDGSTAFFVQLF